MTLPVCNNFNGGLGSFHTLPQTEGTHTNKEHEDKPLEKTGENDTLSYTTQHLRKNRTKTKGSPMTIATQALIRKAKTQGSPTRGNKRQTRSHTTRHISQRTEWPTLTANTIAFVG